MSQSVIAAPKRRLDETGQMLPQGPKAQRDAAASSTTPDSVLAELATSGLGFIRREVAANRSTPSKVLRNLVPTSFDDFIDQEIALALAENPHTEPNTLADLCRQIVPVLDNGRNHHVGFHAGVALATNPRTPFAALEAMLHPDRTATQFRKVVARETSRRDVIDLLRGDRSETVRRRAQTSWADQSR